MHSSTLHHLRHAKVCTPLCSRHILSLRLRTWSQGDLAPTDKTPTSPQGKDSHMSFTEEMHPRHAGVTWSVNTHFNHAACVKSWFLTGRKKFYHAIVYIRLRFEPPYLDRISVTSNFYGYLKTPSGILMFSGSLGVFCKHHKHIFIGIWWLLHLPSTHIKLMEGYFWVI